MPESPAGRPTAKVERSRLSRRLLGKVAGGAVLATALGEATTQAAPARAARSGIEQIDHIVVLMQENRSFDHYFGRLHFEGQPDAEPLPEFAANPDPLGGPPVRAFHEQALCAVADVDHSWNGTHRAWNGGSMDGFTAVNLHPLDPNGSRVMAYHTSHELGYYYRLYSSFAICDRFFASVMGPTFPNRFYLLAGTSFGHIRNDIPNLFADPHAFSPPNGTLFEQLDNAGVTWKVYYSQVPFAAIFGYVRRRWWNLAPIDQYFRDVRSGRLPQVAFVDPIFLGSAFNQNDEHPPANVQLGQRFVAKVIEALVFSPVWRSSALFLTYDEHGGYFDHVPPPPAPRPDDRPPLLLPGDFEAGFDRYGMRVPLVVVSPFARPRFVSHVVNDHTSLLKFIATRFRLPPLTRRVAEANAMLELFDFERPAVALPPRLPEARIDIAGYLDCIRQSRSLAATHDEGFVRLREAWQAFGR